MDTVLHAALEHICSLGIAGLSLPKLWSKLQPTLTSEALTLCPKVKQALWTNLLDIPDLQFECSGIMYGPHEDIIRSVIDSEQMNLKVIAPEHLRDSFIGIYDADASVTKITSLQRRVLERLAIARANGITQSELGKEFSVSQKDIFYILKKLESRGMIVRQSTVVKTKDVSNVDEAKSASVINTNMVYLYRYARHLGGQKRLEIIKGDKSLVGIESGGGNAASNDCFAEESTNEDVHIRDFMPALKAICDKLSNAEGKVLVVSDIKRELGYKGTAGHRLWRNICHKLKEANVVEEIWAKVDGKAKMKEVNCLHLLKEFSPNHFEPKSRARECINLCKEQTTKLARKGQITDQLVELPIEHQIFDMVDAEGSRGLTFTEVYRRLGINKKRYCARHGNETFSRLGMHLEAERPYKGISYRAWTSPVVGMHTEDISAPLPCDSCTATGENDIIEVEHEVNIIQDGECSSTLLPLTKSQNLDPETENKVPDADLQIVSTQSIHVVPSEVSTPSKSRSDHRYPCLTTVAVSAQREQRILKMLQDEKILIKPDLHRRLDSLQNRAIDRKTLERCLNKLQQEGHCKCIHVSVPVVTNCGRTRTTEVVLHPSLCTISPEVLGQIHEKLRSFETQVRSQCQSRLKNVQTIPILNDVQRIPKGTKLDSQTEKLELMRANGYVMAKMVRTKLLHIYLWGYISIPLGFDDFLSSCKHGYDMKNPHSTCRLINLDAAIKAMPLELFSQIVGSTQKFEDMMEKCRDGLCLLDLPPQEYKCLMDSRATGRLSWLIDILRRLKLIRLVSGEKAEDRADISQATLTYSLEIRPYIEEPVSIAASSYEYFSYDLRPQIRHDFVLSSRKAVDEYWNTLEYCYAAINPKAAVYAFPGSAVNEVFLSRSWASVRVMTSDQRAKLLKRVYKDCSKRKLSFKECEEIAKDLNLTMEQVLRVSYDKRKHSVDRVPGLLVQEESQAFKSTLASSRKRRRLSGAGSSKYGFDGDDLVTDVDKDMYNEAQNPSPTPMSSEGDVGKDRRNDCIRAAEETESNEQNGDDSFIHRRALSKLKPTRKIKFSWTESADRQLVIAYVKCRAALGAKIHRVDWSSLKNLPAPPDACKRRMALLNSNSEFRKALMKLSNVLHARYVKYLQIFQDLSLNQSGSTLVSPESEEHNRDSMGRLNPTTGSFFDEGWDNFDDDNVKVALEDALQLKKKAKLEASKDVELLDDKCADMNICPEELFPRDQDSESLACRSKFSGSKSCSNRIAQKFVKPLKGRITISKQAHQSVAIANALELFKLIFLSTSKSPMVPSLLAETLRRYSEHDLFSAFNYLREKKIMIGGSANSPFVLSQHFLHCISLSPFPINTGKRAAKIAKLLRESEKELMDEGVSPPAVLECGDVFHICGMIASGELSMTPCLPDEGVGEVEDSRVSSKRKSNDSEIADGESSKKVKTSLTVEGELISRKAKGFPGIHLSLRRAKFSRLDILESFKEVVKTASVLSSIEHQIIPFSNVNVHNIASETPHRSAVLSTESPWDVMTSYAEHVWSCGSVLEESNVFHPDLFRSVYATIQKAGDRGLSMREISMAVNLQGEKKVETLVGVLEAFGRVLKVNAYDIVHVVDSLYRSKYFITSSTAAMSGNLIDTIDEKSLTHNNGDYGNGGVHLQRENSASSSEVHRVTILNLHEEVAEPLNGTETGYHTAGVLNLEVTTPTKNNVYTIFDGHSVASQTCRPILPWVNGDGTINELVYKGLVRRVLGFVMQNPGTLEDDIISHMHVLNPQSCRSLLKMMILDNHIKVRKMHQKTSAPPTILQGLLGSYFEKSKLILHDHFFANPTSTTLL
ncbi:unnamed protein product [Cuscuta epithymum]|uniref:B-block binding subunit of TFIIIC domain-containing protein n=1 Tax=Cuscuta epithymum TaxID=186058 RepID=A0AAV0GIW9_9ASTE|nr:unnamed protein product [Cuscuta epithymum]CAH9147688.1 unnamed protein product [Cuscuta epithymum]